MIVSLQQCAGQNHYLLTVNKFFENVAKFKYLGMKVTNEICIHVKTKKTGNTCNHSVKSLLHSHLLCKTLNNEIHEITILSVVLYGREARCVTLREGYRLRVFENRC
jgi:hypothetical protein